MESGMNPDGSGVGVNLDSHLSGDPIPSITGVASANVTVGHTWLIVVAALLLLWLFGGAIFKNIRM
jgi:hypothetical protein